VTPAIPSVTEAARVRAAVARDQTTHWGRLLLEPAHTKKELDRRERLWFRWGSIRFQAQLATRGVWVQKEQSFANER
jgi:hypothetical protein